MRRRRLAYLLKTNTVRPPPNFTLLPSFLTLPPRFGSADRDMTLCELQRKMRVGLTCALSASSWRDQKMLEPNRNKNEAEKIALVDGMKAISTFHKL